MQLPQGRRGERRRTDASGVQLLWLPYNAEMAFIESHDFQSDFVQVGPETSGKTAQSDGCSCINEYSDAPRIPTHSTDYTLISDEA